MGRPLTPLSTSLLGWFATTFVIALLFGNLIFFYMGLIPLFLLLLGLAIDQPSEIEVEREGLSGTIWAGDEVDVTLKVKIGGGLGVVALHDELPAPLELVEGSNFQVLWKGFGEKTATLSYGVRCSKRGAYELPGTEWESEHPLGLRKELKGSSGEETKLMVRPRSTQLRRIRGRKHIAFTPNPGRNVARIGVDTTDFREIREYVAGDPIHDVNWKSTARLAKIDKPLVNEYESEGERVVWLFLDASTSLEVGTTIENVFEHVIRAGDAMSRYFTERGYRVGMYVYNDGGKLYHPGGGEKQYRRLLRELVSLEAHKKEENLDNAVEKCKSQILRYKPFTAVITSIRSESSPHLVEGVKKIRAMVAGRRKRFAPIMIVNVLSHHLNPTPPSQYKEHAGVLQTLTQHSVEGSLRGMGATVVRWDPREESFSKVLLRQARRR